LKKYECLYIVNINFDSEGISTVVAKMEEILKNVGAEVKNTQHWGKRKLAYAIDKERYGNYVLVHFEGENPDITEFQREVEIESGILHYMTIRLDEFPDFDALTVPQAVDADRKRPGMSSAPGGRRPRRYDDDDDVAAADDDDDDDDVVVVKEEVSADESVEEAAVEETPAEEPETPAEKAE